MLLVYLYKQLIQTTYTNNHANTHTNIYTNTYTNIHKYTYTFDTQEIQQIKYVTLRDFLFYPEISYFIRYVADEKLSQEFFNT